MERLRHRKAEQLFGTLHADHYGSMGALCDLYQRLNEDMDVLGLPRFVPYSAFDEGKLNHLTFFFQHLATRFGEFRQLRAVAQEAEVDQATRAMATHILASIHNAPPHFSTEIVLEDLDV